MRKVQAQYPFFDKNALDGGRFFYGNPETQVQFLSGTINLTQFISEKESAQAFAEFGLTIPEGSRNNTVYNGAVKIMKRWGENPKAYRLFLNLADKCDPPLEEIELTQIWNSARKFYRNTVIRTPGYEDPETYNSGDSIRVDRIGRNSESIMNPALTVLLTVQPNVLSGMMQNGTFRGRGLTARFLYCMPTSIVGQ